MLMITIGGNVGTNKEVIAEIGTVGFNCLATCLCAIVGSVLFCLLIEKTVLPLEEYSQMQLDDSEGSARLSVDSDEKKGIDPILILIPVSVLAGAFGCYFFMPKTKVFLPRLRPLDVFSDSLYQRRYRNGTEQERISVHQNGRF